MRTIEPGKLFIAGLGIEVDEVLLEEAFEVFGAVENVNVIRDRTTGQSKGFAFLKFKDEGICEKAISDMKDKLINGNPIHIEQATTGEGRSGSPSMGGDRGRGRGRGRGDWRGGRGRGYSDRGYSDRGYSDRGSRGSSFRSRGRGLRGGSDSGYGSYRDRNYDSDDIGGRSFGRGQSDRFSRSSYNPRERSSYNDRSYYDDRSSGLGDHYDDYSYLDRESSRLDSYSLGRTSYHSEDKGLDEYSTRNYELRSPRGRGNRRFSREDYGSYGRGRDSGVMRGRQRSFDEGRTDRGRSRPDTRSDRDSYVPRGRRMSDSGSRGPPFKRPRTDDSSNKSYSSYDGGSRGGSRGGYRSRGGPPRARGRGGRSRY